MFNLKAQCSKGRLAILISHKTNYLAKIISVLHYSTHLTITKLNITDHVITEKNELQILESQWVSQVLGIHSKNGKSHEYRNTSCTATSIEVNYHSCQIYYPIHYFVNFKMKTLPFGYNLVSHELLCMHGTI